MIYARMYTGGYITVVPYLEVIWCIPFQLYTRFGCFLVSYFVIFFTLPEDTAPKLVFTTTETSNSRLRSVLAPNLGSIIRRRSVTSLVYVPRAPRAQFLLIMRLLALLIIHLANTFFTDRRHMHRFILMPP